MHTSQALLLEQLRQSTNTSPQLLQEPSAITRKLTLHKVQLKDEFPTEALQVVQLGSTIEQWRQSYEVRKYSSGKHDVHLSAVMQVGQMYGQGMH